MSTHFRHSDSQRNRSNSVRNDETKFLFIFFNLFLPHCFHNDRGIRFAGLAHRQIGVYQLAEGLVVAGVNRFPRRESMEFSPISPGISWISWFHAWMRLGTRLCIISGSSRLVSSSRCTENGLEENKHAELLSRFDKTCQLLTGDGIEKTGRTDLVLQPFSQ